MEEDLRTQEALVAHVNVEGVLTDGVDAAVLFDPFPRVRVVLCELLHNVRTDVTVPLLHTEVHTEVHRNPGNKDQESGISVEEE